MLRKVLSDENANAKKKTDTLSSLTVASKRNGIRMKKVALGGGHDPTQARIFAREIKNVVGGISCQNANATVNELEYGRPGELGVLNQFTTDFGMLTLRGVDATQEIMPHPGHNLFAARDSTGSRFSTHPQWPVSSIHSLITCAVCKNRPTGSSGYGSDIGSQISSTTMVTCHCRRRNAFNRTRKSSFRSASIASQSTPLPARVAFRSVRPLYALDDDSKLHFRNCTNPEPKTACRLGPEIEALNEALDKTTGQTTGTDDTADNGGNELMTQLASQLSQLAISPYNAPVEDNSSDILNVELGSPSLSSSPPSRTRLKGRIASFSLGFIPVAFPDEIDVNDLRIIPLKNLRCQSS